VAIRGREEIADLETDALRLQAVLAKGTHVVLLLIAADHRPCSGCGSATNRTFPPAPVTSTAGAGGFQTSEKESPNMPMTRKPPHFSVVNLFVGRATAESLRT
jgi:hypothetical protein